ncbi:hypothetical protein U1Q18_049218 [Sarracenia purpurea var. burkii]
MQVEMIMVGLGGGGFGFSGHEGFDVEVKVGEMGRHLGLEDLGFEIGVDELQRRGRGTRKV